MSETNGILKEKVTSELKRAIRNINRNLYEWKNMKAGKTNFSISYTEVYSVTRNWFIRCLRSVIDTRVADAIFRKGHLFLSINESEMCISGITVDFHKPSMAYYYPSEIIAEALKSIKFEELRYNPKDYEVDGVTQKVDDFYYPLYENTSFDVNDYNSLIPKN